VIGRAAHGEESSILLPRLTEGDRVGELTHLSRVDKEPWYKAGFRPREGIYFFEGIDSPGGPLEWSESNSQLQARSLLSLPIWNGSRRPVGVIQVMNKIDEADFNIDNVSKIPPFTVADQHFVNTLGSAAGRHFPEQKFFMKGEIERKSELAQALLLITLV